MTVDSEAIVGWLPPWTDLIRLPLVFLGLEHSAAISSSTFAWPQHIFLAPAAFARPATLAEQVTHETSHQWLYLLRGTVAVAGGQPERPVHPAVRHRRTKPQ
jgi:hypothetical protein